MLINTRRIVSVIIIGLLIHQLDLFDFLADEQKLSSATFVSLSDHGDLFHGEKAEPAPFQTLAHFRSNRVPPTLFSLGLQKQPASLSSKTTIVASHIPALNIVPLDATTRLPSPPPSQPYLERTKERREGSSTTDIIKINNGQQVDSQHKLPVGQHSNGPLETTKAITTTRATDKTSSLSNSRVQLLDRRRAVAEQTTTAAAAASQQRGNRMITGRRDSPSADESPSHQQQLMLRATLTAAKISEKAKIEKDTLKHETGEDISDWLEAKHGWHKNSKHHDIGQSVLNEISAMNNLKRRQAITTPVIFPSPPAPPQHESADGQQLSMILMEDRVRPLGERTASAVTPVMIKSVLSKIAASSALPPSQLLMPSTPTVALVGRQLLDEPSPSTPCENGLGKICSGSMDDRLADFLFGRDKTSQVTSKMVPKISLKRMLNLQKRAGEQLLPSKQTATQQSGVTPSMKHPMSFMHFG